MTDTIAGGYYWDATTKKHVDAWGKPVEKHSEAELKKAREEHVALSPDQAELLMAESKAQQRAAEAQAALDAANAEAKYRKVTPQRSTARKSAKGK